MTFIYSRVTSPCILTGVYKCHILYADGTFLEIVCKGTICAFFAEEIPQTFAHNLQRNLLPLLSCEGRSTNISQIERQEY